DHPARLPVTAGPGARWMVAPLLNPRRLEERLGAGRERQAEMPVRLLGRHAPARRALEQAALDEERLVHLFERRPVLADSRRQGVEANGATDELADDGVEDGAVAAVQTGVVDAEGLQSLASPRQGDAVVAGDLGVVAHAPQQALRDAHGAAGAPSDLERGLVVEVEPEEGGVAPDALGKLLTRVVLEVLDDPEAAAQRTGDEAGPRRRAHEREAG